jgi:DNA-binding HxlR family transcriptional regulator
MPRLNHEALNKQFKKINGKWKPMIMIVLYTRPERFNRIKYRLPGINPKILSKCLKELEEDEIILKSSQYELTEKATKIVALMLQIKSILDD